MAGPFKIPFGGPSIPAVKKVTVAHDLATAEHDFLTGKSGGGEWIKKTLAEAKEILAQVTTLSVSQTIAADTNFSLTSSGTGYTHSNDAGLLPGSAALFNAAGSVKVFVSGVLQENGVGAIWVNTTTFKLNAAVDNGDVIVIFS